MRILSSLSVLALPSLAASSYGTKNDVEDLLQWEQLVEGGNWASLTEDSAFVRVPSTDAKMNGATDEAISRFLESSSSSSNHYSDYLRATGTGFEYSANAEYEQYQLAWRYLGLSIDCSITADQRRGSHDDEDDEDQSCARVLLYAVYVDFDYQDDAGLGQYQFYNRKTGNWVGCGNNKNYGYGNKYYGNKYYGNKNKYYGYNANAEEEEEEEEVVEEANVYYGEEEEEEAGNNYGYRERELGNNNNGDRCVQMDCHLQDTHYTLLGVFKNYSPETWMEQLFKHEGICVWTDEEYAISQAVRKSLPERCTPIGYEGSGDRDKDKDEDENNGNQNNGKIIGEGLYYHIKPEMGGNIGLGLYSDAACTIEYSGGLTLQQVVEGNYDLCDSSGYAGYNATGYYYSDYLEKCGKNSPALLYQYLDKFNDAMNIYKQCQSCVAYDLDSDDFQCDDDAGYTNCMQCMKFKEKADSLPAFASDLLLASRMNSMLAIDINGIRYGYGGYTSGVEVYNGDFAYSAEVDRELEAKYAKAAHHGGPMGGYFYYCSIGALACSILFFIKVKFIDDFTSKRQGANDRNQPLLESNGGDMS